MKASFLLIGVFGLTLVLAQNETSPDPEPEGEPEPEPEPVSCQVCSGNGCSVSEIQSVDVNGDSRTRDNKNGVSAVFLEFINPYSHFNPLHPPKLANLATTAYNTK